MEVLCSRWLLFHIRFWYIQRPNSISHLTRYTALGRFVEGYLCALLHRNATPELILCFEPISNLLQHSSLNFIEAVTLSSTIQAWLHTLSSSHTDLSARIFTCFEGFFSTVDEQPPLYRNSSTIVRDRHQHEC